MEVNGIKLALDANDPDDGDAGRRLRGAAMATLVPIKKTPVGYKVPSQSGAGSYIVNLDDDDPYCSCPDFELRQQPCKHIFSVEYLIQREERPDGTTVETKAVRVTYSQDWPAYNAAQVNEGDHFVILLRELCDGIEQTEYTFGRPRLPVSDMLFGMAVKVYSTMSGRRAMSDIRSAEALGLMDKVPHFNSILRYMEKPEMKELLRGLIQQSALPLASVETHFSPDSSGFATSVYHRWYDHKHGREIKEAKWVKAHIMTGVNTNIITDADVTDVASNDSPYLIPFLNTTVRNFDVQEVSADKAYLSKRNLRAVEGAGATPLIPFKVNSVPFTPNHKRDSVWERTFYYFNLHRNEFLSRYHKRSNVESTFSAIKAKFGGSVRSKNPTAQVNETLTKLLCHNICCLIGAMYTLGIHPEFFSFPSVVEGETRLNVQSEMVLA